ncbi:hypothetical protein AB832_03855 [Flavobacteriaceae bacterium (ex Bugula neritina AB1)]|nr:hypothetical protein AB832_03855 [Flavobacteriaceae bacterium (ex Bugula neritina AB1)]
MKHCVTKGISQDWTAFYQSIPLHYRYTAKFRLTAIAKIQSSTPYSTSAIWARIDHKDGSRGFFDTMTDRPIVSNEWKEYMIEGILDENASLLNFGGLCKYTGVFCFTNFSLSIENEKGILEKITINNPGFDGVMDQFSMTGWEQGTARKAPIEIKEYRFSSDYSKKLGTSYLQVIGSAIFGIDTQYTPQIKILLCMLQDVGKRMVRAIQELGIPEIDYLPNERLNSIGVLITHIAATEAYYQIATFRNSTLTEEERLLWETALNMGEKAHKKYIGHSIDYYLDIYHRVREKTLHLFRHKSDDWLRETSFHHHNNHHHWLHVLEHQSYHLGQIIMIRKMT